MEGSGVKMGESLVDVGEIIVDKLICFFTDEVINTRKRGSLPVQIAQLFLFPIPLDDAGLIQVLWLGRVIKSLCSSYSSDYFVTEYLLEASVVVVGDRVLLLH